MQERAQIFMKLTGGVFTGWRYINWIRRGATAYRRERGLTDTMPIANHADFTAFLREHGRLFLDA